MAQHVQVVLVDDLDGGKATETVSFALDGVSYEIDLSDKNAGKLRDALSSWVGHARRASGRRGPARGRAASRSTSSDLSATREWGRKNGFKVSDRGRLSAELQEAFRRTR
jgi:Lsr2